MRRLALLLILCIPLAGAQGVQQVTWSGGWAVSTIQASACDDSVLEILDEASFRFSEPTLVAGCGQAVMDVTLPPGTGSLEVRFAADRQVEGVPLGPRNMVQEVHFQAGQATDAREIFPLEAGDRPVTEMAFLFDVPDGQESARIAWVFEDAGVAAGIGGEALHSVVQDVRLRVEQVAAEAVIHDAGSYLDGREIVHVHEASIEIPAAPDVLRFRVMEWQVSALRTPDRVVPASELVISQVGETAIVSLPPGDEFPSGVYLLQGTTRSDAPAVPMHGIHPAVWMLLGLPLLLGTLSIHGATRFYQQAPPGRRRDGTRLLVQNATIAAGYLALLGTAYLARDRLAAGNFSNSTWLLLVQMGAVSLAFLTLWQLGSRQMTRRLQSDIAKVEKEERQLRRLNDELQRSNEDLERFARVASHDLKEPLRSVQFHAEKLAAKYAGVLDSRGQKSLQLAAGGARRMRDLVDGISAYSSVDQRMGTPTRFEVREAAEAVVTALEALIREQQATVELGPLPPMVGHQGLIEQALQNLVTNAIKHGGRGRHIRVRGRRGAGRYLLEVEDDGPGIPQEYHERIFEVFQRLDGRTEEGGTGMGLAIVKRIAEVHGGTAGLRSEPCQGAIFYLDLPELEVDHGDPRRR